MGEKTKRRKTQKILDPRQPFMNRVCRFLIAMFAIKVLHTRFTLQRGINDMMEILLKNISKLFGSVAAVDDVSVTIAPGEFFFLLGPSGCGKTTLLRIVAGLTQHTSGTIFFGDRDVSAMPAEK